MEWEHTKSASLYAKKIQLKHNSSTQITFSIKQNALFDLIVCNGKFSRIWQKTCMWYCTLMTFIPLSCIRKEETVIHKTSQLLMWFQNMRDFKANSLNSPALSIRHTKFGILFISCSNCLFSIFSFHL